MSELKFDYNKCVKVAKEYGVLNRAVYECAKLVFRLVKFRGCDNGHVCEGWDFTISHYGEVLIRHNMYDGYDGELPANCHFTFPFRFLNMTKEEIVHEFESAPDGGPCGVNYDEGIIG